MSPGFGTNTLGEGLAHPLQRAMPLHLSYLSAVDEVLPRRQFLLARDVVGLEMCHAQEPRHAIKKVAIRDVAGRVAVVVLYSQVVVAACAAEIVVSRWFVVWPGLFLLTQYLCHVQAPVPTDLAGERPVASFVRHLQGLRCTDWVSGTS